MNTNEEQGDVEPDNHLRSERSFAYENGEIFNTAHLISYSNHISPECQCRF